MSSSSSAYSSSTYSSSSSSSSDEYHEFYLKCPRISLEVEDENGIIHALEQGGVVLQASANFEFVLDEEDDEVRMNAGNVAESAADPYYQEKYEAFKALTFANGAGNPVTGPTVGTGTAWTFTRDSMWLATVNGLYPDERSGAFFLVTDPCAVVGEFDDNSHDTWAYAQAFGAELAVFDVCAPCVDCLTWRRLDQYLTRIEAFYDYMFELIYNDNTPVPPVHPDGGTPEIFNGLYWQWLAAQRMWDYLVNSSTAKFSAQGQGQSIVTAGYYRNISDVAVGPLTASVTWVFTKGGVIWEGIDSGIVESRWLVRNTSDNIMIKDALNPDEIGTYYLKTYGTLGGNLPSTEVVYVDVALLIDDSKLPKELADFRVYVIFELNPTHLIDTNVLDWSIETWEWADIVDEHGGPTGRVIKSEIVYFVPRDLTESST